MSVAKSALVQADDTKDRNVEQEPRDDPNQPGNG